MATKKETEELRKNVAAAQAAPPDEAGTLTTTPLSGTIEPGMTISDEGGPLDGAIIVDPSTAVSTLSDSRNALEVRSDMLLESAGEGFEDVTAGDVALPFWKIAQPMTHQCQEGDPLFVPGLRPGMWFDVISGEFCHEIDFVPCRFVTHYIEWGPTIGDGMVANHGKDRSIFEACVRDEESGRWVLPAGRPHAGNVVVPTPTWFGIITAMVQRGDEYMDEKRQRQRHPDRVETNLIRRAVLTLAGTAEKISRRWVADAGSIKINKRREDGTVQRFQCPLYGMTYHLASTATKNNKGAWHLPTVSRAGWTLDLNEGEEVFREAREFHALSKEIKPTVVRDEEESGASNGGGQRNGNGNGTRTYEKRPGADPHYEPPNDDTPF